MTIFSPAATHFLVQASPAAFAPLAPHLASVIHPLTVVLFPMSSNASADKAKMKLTARQISRTFLMAGSSPFENSICDPTPQQPTIRRRSCRPIRERPTPRDCEMRQRKYTTAQRKYCQDGCTETVHQEKAAQA